MGSSVDWALARVAISWSENPSLVSEFGVMVFLMVRCVVG
jgi:hypothetical protein